MKSKSVIEYLQREIKCMKNWKKNYPESNQKFLNKQIRILQKAIKIVESRTR